MTEQRMNNKGVKMADGRIKAVYNIIRKENMEKPIWNRVGTAWLNRDNSLNVKLDYYPVNNQLQIRDLPIKK